MGIGYGHGKPNTRITKKKTKCEKIILSRVTIDFQLGAVAALASRIASPTGVDAPMLSGYIVNVKSAGFAGHAADDHIPVAADQCLIVQRPANVDGQITLNNGALNAHSFARVGGLVAKVKGSNLWGNCGMVFIGISKSK